MTVLTWDSDPVTEGLDRVVLFPPAAPGIPWNGFTRVSRKESGSSTTLYYDGQAYQVATAEDSYSAAISAITYPETFEVFENYPHPIFGLSYRETTTTSYKIHLVWNLVAVPSDTRWGTRADGVELTEFTWDISATPMEIEEIYPTAHFTLDAEAMPPAAIAKIEAALYGSSTTDPYLPQPSELLQLVRDNPWVRITDLGDGTFTIEGPEELVRQIDATTFDIESGGIIFVDDDEYDIQTW